MPFLEGPISSRLRKLFAKDDMAWKPPADRNDSPKRGQKLPKGVEGHKLGKRGRGKS